MTKVIWENPTGIVSRQQYKTAVQASRNLSDKARSVGIELARELRRDAVSQTTISQMARRFDTDPAEIGRALGELRSKGYVSADKHPAGIACTLPELDPLTVLWQAA
ncbi:hypothetical protein [Arthrobacter roseus]|uniref:hypothetical protein n=1 Tax=Arthrobacter roseus TaxID=136274 RepID=UPI0019651794|nr:hypothetical protein [Arthrobacter roseus]MBM7848807.1 CRP-like cAMP-binding protein [Arthrobacter roseus]